MTKQESKCSYNRLWIQEKDIASKKYHKWRWIHSYITLSAENPQIYEGISSHAAAAAKLLQSCLTLCDPVDGSLPDSRVPGILQARILEWVAISFFNECMHAKSLQSYPTVCDPMDSSPPGSSDHAIL